MDLFSIPPRTNFAPRSAPWLIQTRAPHRTAVDGQFAEGFEAHREWEATMAADRIVAGELAEEYGGRNAPAALGDLRGGVSPVGALGRVSQNGIFLLAPTLFETRVEGQLDRIMLRMAAPTTSGAGVRSPSRAAT